MIPDLFCRGAAHALCFWPDSTGRQLPACYKLVCAYLMTKSLYHGIAFCFIVSTLLRRACVQAHKLALTAQRHFWYIMLRDAVSLEEVQTCLDNLGLAEDRATKIYKRCEVTGHIIDVGFDFADRVCLAVETCKSHSPASWSSRFLHVYISIHNDCFHVAHVRLFEREVPAPACRVMELYPKNGKLLKVYGRYLEFVRNDPWTAGKYYAEALKLGTSESLLNLLGDKETSLLNHNLEQVDEKVDAIIIINAVGVMLMANSVSSAAGCQHLCMNQLLLALGTLGPSSCTLEWVLPHFHTLGVPDCPVGTPT